MPRSRDARTRKEISVSLQTGAPLRKLPVHLLACFPVACAPVASCGGLVDC